MKKLLSIITVILVAFGVYGVLKPIIFPTMTGEKTIELSIVVDDENGQIEVFSDLVHTDSETLGDLLDEVDEFYDELDFSYSGEKTDAWGRMILSINEYETLDMSTGPWWLINSDNNKDCAAAGFCNGIDLQSVYDQDHFELNFTSAY